MGKLMVRGERRGRGRGREGDFIEGVRVSGCGVKLCEVEGKKGGGSGGGAVLRRGGSEIGGNAKPGGGKKTVEFCLEFVFVLAFFNSTG